MPDLSVISSDPIYQHLLPEKAAGTTARSREQQIDYTIILLFSRVGNFKIKFKRVAAQSAELPLSVNYLTMKTLFSLPDFTFQTQPRCKYTPE